MSILLDNSVEITIGILLAFLTKTNSWSVYELQAMTHSPLFFQIGLGLLSVAFAELVRDCYHLAGHYCKSLQRLHGLHHKAYRRDFTISSEETYRKAQLYNDVPEAAAMAGAGALLVVAAQNYALVVGCAYSIGFLIIALSRSQGLLWATDLTHKQGDLVGIPSIWRANRTYHWRHHFDQQNAYFSAHLTLVDKMLGTSLSLKGKTAAITGASGSMGRALIKALSKQGAKLIALTTSDITASGDTAFDGSVEVVQWQPGREFELTNRLKTIDILIINHGVNLGRDRSPDAIRKSYEVNTFSAWRLAELFLGTVTESEHRAIKELWINTSEAEAVPVFNPLYELSKRTLGNLITLRRLDAPCIIRKLILGPFKSKLNPIGVMSSGWVAGAVVALAKRDFRNIIVTINPLIYIAFPIKEFFASLYFQLFSRNTK